VGMEPSAGRYTASPPRAPVTALAVAGPELRKFMRLAPSPALRRDVSMGPSLRNVGSLAQASAGKAFGAAGVGGRPGPGGRPAGPPGGHSGAHLPGGLCHPLLPFSVRWCTGSQNWPGYPQGWRPVSIVQSRRWIVGGRQRLRGGWPVCRSPGAAGDPGG
jgi:hypothetical protein